MLGNTWVVTKEDDNFHDGYQSQIFSFQLLLSIYQKVHAFVEKFTILNLTPTLERIIFFVFFVFFYVVVIIGLVKAGKLVMS